MTPRMNARRVFLLSLGALGISPAFPQTAPRFPLGVASGYPTASSVVLWTRVTSPGQVHWEVSSDEAMKTIVRRGAAAAQPEWAHSIHVEPQGLEPDRWYWYRFATADAQSPVGRAPRPPHPRRPPACGSASLPASTMSRASSARTATWWPTTPT
jgi:alkaline phosphatase D